MLSYLKLKAFQVLLFPMTIISRSPLAHFDRLHFSLKAIFYFYGADPLEYHHTAHTGQPGAQAQPEWVCERQVLFNQLGLIL